MMVGFFNLVFDAKIPAKDVMPPPSKTETATGKN
jgi:hypothetical protein